MAWWLVLLVAGQCVLDLEDVKPRYSQSLDCATWLIESRTLSVLSLQVLLSLSPPSRCRVLPTPGGLDTGSHSCVWILGVGWGLDDAFVLCHRWRLWSWVYYKTIRVTIYEGQIICSEPFKCHLKGKCLF